jgi:uncharacterized protein (TIGR02266 family)
LDDRRRHTRISLGVSVDVTSGSNFFVGRTRDLSMGGLFIETPVPLPIGSVVAVDLLLNGKKHALAATVAWALDRPGGETVGVGVSFNDLTPRARNAILAFMKQRAPVEFEMLEPEPEPDEPEPAAPAPEPPGPPPLPGGKPPPLPGA